MIALKNTMQFRNNRSTSKQLILVKKNLERYGRPSLVAIISARLINLNMVENYLFLAVKLLYFFIY